jgi:hypothetical protein
MSDFPTLPDFPQDFEVSAHSDVLLCEARVDQARIRTAVDAVFAAHPNLGAVYEPTFDQWTTRPGGGWAWAVEPPGVAVADVIARQRGSFDMRTGRLFVVSLLPGDPDRLVLTASHLCMDAAAWQLVVDDLMTAYNAEPEQDGDDGADAADTDQMLTVRTSVPA